MSEALRFLAVAELLGLAALPLAALVLGRIPGSGLAFAKPLGLLAAAYPVWWLASLGVAPYGDATAWAGVGALAVGGVVLWRRFPGRAPWRAGPDRRLLLGAEGTFLAAFAGGALLSAFSPDVRGTEKPMDMAFLTAVNASSSFPPHDPWMAGEDLNYYWLGHYLMAFVVRLAGVEPSAGYNLALALTLALSAVAAYGLASAVSAAAGVARPVSSGIVAAGFACLAGNLEGARLLLVEGGPLASYDWFAPSRVIPDAITEFPAFSFVLGDLHAHVLAIPFTLMALAFGLQAALSGPRLRDLAAAGVALGLLYAVNSWSYPVAGGLMVLAGALWLRESWSTGAAARLAGWAAGLLGVSVLAFLPFWLAFEPDTRGLGLVAERRPLHLFARDQALTVGVFLLILGVAGAWRVAGVERPWRAAGERFVWLLAAGGAACILIGEVVYVRDEFDGTEFVRMNTIFKLGYQAWLLLAVAAACALPLARGRLGRAAWIPVALAAGVVLSAYPVAGTYARKAAFVDGPRLDGMRWLELQAPGDVTAIAWLRKHAAPGAVVLEAVGDDYSELGHTRISTFSGRATVLGWSGHELQWGHDPGSRRDDVARIYRGENARELLARYGVDYVVAGPLERTDYGDSGFATFDELGQRVLHDEGTVLWKLQRRT